MLKRIVTFILIMTFLSIFAHGAEDKCREVLRACDELREVQQKEIGLLEEVVVEERLKNEELDKELDHAKIWLWIIPPIGLLYMIFE